MAAAGTVHEALLAELLALPYFSQPPPKSTGRELFGAAYAAALRQRAIIVRHFRQPRIDQFLRITVGTDQQCGILIGALTEILGH